MTDVHLFSLPDALRTQVQAEFQPGEEIRWAGQPVPKVHFWILFYLMAVGLFGTAFMIYWMAGAAGIGGFFENEPIDAFRTFRYAFALMGLPGLAASLAMVLAPLWLPVQIRRVASRSVYVITDRRAIVFDSGFRSGAMGSLASALVSLWQKELKIRSFLPKQLRKVERIELPDGSGDLIFDRHSWRDSDGDRQTTLYGFFSLPNIREVAENLNCLTKGL